MLYELMEGKLKGYPDYLKEICEKYANDFHPKNDVDKIEQKVLVDERYNIVLLYEPDVTEKVTKFSIETNSIIPCTLYENDKCHTTVGVFRGHELNTNIPEDEIVIREKLITLADEIKKIEDIKIYFGRMLINKDSVILSGFPNKGFWKTQDLLDQKNDQFLRLRLAWGAHMTAARFSVNESNLGVISKLHDHVKKLDIIGEVAPSRIAITKFKVRPGVYDHEILWVEKLP